MYLYAHAAVGPLKENPAWLQMHNYGDKKRYFHQLDSGIFMK